MSVIDSLGFIGLGTMGEPMCANLRRKSGLPVYAFDRRAEPMRRLEAAGVEAAGSAAEVARRARLVFLSLPGGREVEEVCCGAEGLAMTRDRRVEIVVDCGTSPVALTRTLAERLWEAGIAFADAPVARTREAAQQGRLSIMVGAEAGLFARVQPLLAMMGSDVTPCGPVGNGQAIKILNNMVLFETVGALAEAMVIARRAGVDEALLLETLSKGSADSFALRNHAMKAMLPRRFPENAFAAEYALKDLSYALALARDGGAPVPGAELTAERLSEAIGRGFGRNYWPVIFKMVAGED